jgi:signal peptidase II
MKNRSKYICLGIGLFLFSFLDFYFSNLISYKLANGWHFTNSLVKLVYVENTGAAFSIMQNSTLFLIILSIASLLVMFYFVIKNIETIFIKDIFFLSLLTSGILGNLYERLFFGYVRDFFDLTFINFPIFNISDIFINIGVLGIIIMILFMKKSIKIV